MSLRQFRAFLHRRTGRAAATLAAAALSTAGLVGATASPASAVDLRWLDVSSGFLHSCAIRVDHTMWCWGAGAAGQLGIGRIPSGEDSDKPSRQLVAGGLSWASVVAGDVSTCGLTTGGDLYCWGSNVSGQLGLGDRTTRYVPTRVDTGPWLSLSVGRTMSCGVSGGRRLYCWGDNRRGQLGTGDTEEHLVPTRVTTRTDWQSVTVNGLIHACALTTGGKRYCWGSNDVGQLGLGGTGDRKVPTSLIGEMTWTSVSAGSRYTCGIGTDRRSYCWGSNLRGQLGVGDTADRLSVTRTTSSNPWAQITAGSVSTCGLYPDGMRFCWGYNADSQLGVGDTTQRTRPTRLLGEAPWSQLAAGSSHACGIQADGILSCWGSGSSGQLGVGDRSNRSRPAPIV